MKWKWKWSLKKKAAEEAVPTTPPQPQNVNPQPQVQPKAEPALTPVVQPQPVKPQKQTGWGLPKDQTAEQLLKSPQYVKSVQTFVTRNIESLQQEGQVTEYAPQAFQQYKATPETMKFFETVARPMVEQAGLKYEDFIAKLDPHKSQETLQQIEEKKQEGGFIENDKDETIANELIHEQLIRLEDVGTSILSDWINEKAQETDKMGEPTPVAQGIPNAIHNFLFNKGGGNAIKWKSFFKDHVELLPKDVKKRIPATQNSVYKAINQSIYEWYKENEGFEEHPCISTLESLMESRDPRILKALEKAAKAEEVVQTQLSHSQDGGGDKGQSLSGNIASPGAFSIADALAGPGFSEEDMQSADQIIDGFLERHPDFLEKLRSATYPGENFSMVEAMAKKAQETAAGIDAGKYANKILNDALRYPITGYVYKQDESGINTTIPDHNKWNDFFIRFDNLLPTHIDLDPESLDDHSSEALQTMASPQAQKAIDEYFGDPSQQNGECYNYLKSRYELSTQKLGKINTYVAGVGDIKQIARLGKMAYGVVFREFKLRQQDGSAESKVGSSARGYALLKARVREINKLLLRLANSKEPQRLTKNRYIFRNDKGELMIHEKVEGKKGNKNIQYRTIPLSDQNFQLLADAIPSNWTDGMWDILLGKDKMKGEIDFPSAVAGKKWPEQKMLTKPLGKDFQTASDTYQQQHPEDPDRLHGWRLHLAKVLNERIQQLSQAIGKPLTAQDIADRVKKVKSATENTGKMGARIDGVAAIERLLKGEPTPYDENAFALLAKALSTLPGEQTTQPIKLTADDIYAENFREYDKYSYDDRTALKSLVPGIIAQYGPYLIHRKREAIRRKQSEDVFSDHSMWQFLLLLGCRTYTGKTEKRLGWYAHELAGGIPFSDVMTPEQFLQHLQTEEKPDIYDKMDYRKDKPVRYVPDEKHPLGYQEQPERMDVSAVLSKINKLCKQQKLPFANANEFLAHYRQEALARWNHIAQDNTAEVLRTRLQQKQSPVDIAKELLSKSVPPEQAEAELQKRMQTYNSFLASHGKANEQLDFQDYAAKLVNNTIANHETAKDAALAKLQKVDSLDKGPKPKGEKDPGYYINLEQQLNLFLPAKVKNDLYVFHEEPKNVPTVRKELEEQANSTLSEQIKTELATLSPVEVAKNIFKSKGMDDAKALENLTLKMKKYNKRTERYNKTVAPEKQRKLYPSIEEYAADYVQEVARLDEYYKEIARQRLEQVNKGEKRDNEFPKFSEIGGKLIKLSEQLSEFAEQQLEIPRFGSSLAVMNIIDQLVDNGIREIYEYAGIES